MNDEYLYAKIKRGIIKGGKLVHGFCPTCKSRVGLNKDGKTRRQVCKHCNQWIDWGNPIRKENI